MKMTLWVGCMAALAFGCGDDDTMGDTGAGRDTGPMEDVGAGDTGTADTGPGDASIGVDVSLGEDVGIGEDAGIAEDAGPEPTCPDLMPTQGADNVIISQYNLMTGEVEFYNPTDEALPIDGLELCSRPAYETIDSDIMVQPGSFATYVARATFQGANPSRGELALYDSTSYESRNSMIDFVCWGETLAPSRSRKHVAEMLAGEEVLWEGGCSPSPVANVVARGVGNAGTGADDYTSDQGFAPHACE